jgi:hypothetical protein
MPNGFSWTRAAKAVTLAGCLLLASRAALAQTTELTPGDDVTPPPTLGADLGGALVDFLISPFNETFNGQTITGNVISAVYTGGTPEDGVFGGAAFDFYYQIEFTGGNSVITGVNPASFLGFRTSVGQVNDGDGAGGVLGPGTESSAQARRTIDGEGMNFDFIGFTPGETSLSLIVRTDATTALRTGSMGILGSGVTATVLTLAPVAFGFVAPEPGALGLLALGSVAFVALRRRR